MREKQIVSRRGDVYYIESFEEKKDVREIGDGENEDTTAALGRSYSLHVRKLSALPPVPEGIVYPANEDSEPTLKFRFNLSDRTIENFDEAIYGKGEQGYRRRIERTFASSIDEGTENLEQNDEGEFVINF